MDAGLTLIREWCVLGAMELVTLGSGSKGNSCVIRVAGHNIMIDAGLSALKLNQRLHSAGVSRLDAIVLTHEHGDHVAGLKTFLRKCDVPIYATAHTAQVVRETGVKASWRTFEAGQGFRIGAVELSSFPTQHDAVDPVGFVVSGAGFRLGVLSDAGHVTATMERCMEGLDALFVESNYDEDLLERDQKRPWSIKQRIASRHGHLSNTQSAELVSKVAHAGLQRVILGHLSGDCNQPELAVAQVQRSLQDKGFAGVAVECAKSDQLSGWWSLARMSVEGD